MIFVFSAKKYIRACNYIDKGSDDMGCGSVELYNNVYLEFHHTLISFSICCIAFKVFRIKLKENVCAESGNRKDMACAYVARHLLIQCFF